MSSSSVVVVVVVIVGRPAVEQWTKEPVLQQTCADTGSVLEWWQCYLNMFGYEDGEC